MQLNPAQRAAVEHDASPLLIIAGAGSGKTATLARRGPRPVQRRAPPPRTPPAALWCRDHAGELKRLFAAYVDLKQEEHVLDYDDLLLWWLELMRDEGAAARVRRRFDHLLVDEYQDTNAIQARILERLAPDGRGVTVVGDDAQSIYSFRAATVRNILDFPARFEPPARVVTLEQNYRSTQPILEAANAVIAQARERFTKNLFSQRVSSEKPLLVSAADEPAQVEYVVTRVLETR